MGTTTRGQGTERSPVPPNILNPAPPKHRLHFAEAKLAITYMLIAGTWIIVSDHFVSNWVHDPELLSHLQTYKGWLFVVVTALLLGFLTHHHVKELRQSAAVLDENQKRLAGIIGSAMDAIISVDDEHKIVLFNAAAEKMFGCPAADAISQPIERFIPARFRDGHREHFRRFAATGESTRQMHLFGMITGLRRNGEEFPAEAAISHVDVSGHKLFTVIVRDVTERKRIAETVHKLNAELEQRVASRTAELEEANRELEAFSYSVSHDLRAPLRTVEGFSQILVEDFSAQLPLEGHRHLQTIRQGVQRMRTLIDDLLRFSGL
ncbi:MAG: PAS domain S-box protein, partial [Deltaproteobacteria bacterium]|nr:PAS domain S-box protein [Deltaproteobacteria bacterium]